MSGSRRRGQPPGGRERARRRRGALWARAALSRRCRVQAVAPYMAAFVAAPKAEEAARLLLARCIEDTKVEKAKAEDDDEGEDLCNCEFSLAYGGKILLNNATLWLKRGRRYGLCGPNGAGKSTLMKAISNGQLEGFPPRSELRTVYVEHDIQADAADLCCLDYVMADPMVAELPENTREEVAKVMATVGFDKTRQEAGVTSLSGGWKMKLALSRAMLTKSDIFLLDEPTNHVRAPPRGQPPPVPKAQPRPRRSALRAAAA